jgi:hypothetical protein
LGERISGAKARIWRLIRSFSPDFTRLIGSFFFSSDFNEVFHTTALTGARNMDDKINRLTNGAPRNARRNFTG